MTHTSPIRRLLAVAAVAATLPLAAACGSGATPPTTSASSPAAASSTTTSETATAAGDDAYCAALKSGQKELEGISGSISDQAALKQGLAVIQKIKDTAPAEVEQAWGDFIAFVEAASSGNTSAMAGAMEKMDAAGTKIEQHAKTACNLDIS